MKDPFYTLTIPVFTKLLTQADVLLAKAEAYVADKGISESEILEARLAPDMFPFVKQVQVVCDNAKGAAARLTGVENPKMEDTEKTFAELRARVQKTLAFVKTFTPEQFAHAAEQKPTLPYFKDMHFTGEGYLVDYAIPNFYFHYTTMYDILRMKGLQIGKADFVGSLPLQND